MAMIRAARRGDHAAMGEIWEQAREPAVLTGQCIGALLDMAQIIATQLGAADGPALIGAILEQAASGKPAPEPPAPGAPQVLVVNADSPEGRTVAAAAILAVFDDDIAGLNAVLGHLTHAEAIAAATAAARIFVAAVHEEDRPAVREALAQELRSGPAEP